MDKYIIYTNVSYHGMSCHIIWLHMKYPELLMGLRVCHPSTSQWTERVALCFFCPAGGGRVPWSKVWRCRGMFKQTGRNIQLGSQTVALDISWSIIGFSDYHGMIITFPSITGSSTKENILDQVVLFPRRSSMVMKRHARVLTRGKPMWNCWAGRTAGLVFHGISWVFLM